jgi:hypothetical protein
VLDYECGVQAGQGERAVHVEQVDRQDGLGVGAEKGAPLVIACGWWRDLAAAQDLADRARADPVPEAAQLALDPDHAPAPVLCGEEDDQLDDSVVERWPSRWPGLGPLPGHHAAVPAQQRSRGHDPVQAQAFRQHSRQCCEEGTIGPLQPRPGVHPAQHRDLLAQDQYFGVLRRR